MFGTNSHVVTSTFDYLDHMHQTAPDSPLVFFLVPKLDEISAADYGRTDSSLMILMSQSDQNDYRD
jgi:hypothetical protein